MDDRDSPTMPGYLPLTDERDPPPGQPDSMSKSLDPSLIFSVAHGSLAIASLATRFGFSVAQKSVQLGLAIPQTIISNVLPSQLKPVSTVIQAGLSFAEFSTLTALQLAEGISTGSLDLAAYSITELDSLIKSYQLLQPSLPSLDALKLVVLLLRQQWEKITPHSSDLPPGNTAEPFKVFQVLRALSSWALIQQLTQHVEDRQLSSYLIHVPPSLENNQKPVQIEPGLEEYDQEDSEVVKQKFKRYINLSISSYGGLGHIMFNSDRSPSSEDSQTKASSQSGKAYNTWDLLLGKHDHDLLREHGELLEDTYAPEAYNEGDRKITEELKDLLPAVDTTTHPLAQQNQSEKGEDEEKNKDMTDLMKQIGSLGVEQEPDDAKDWSIVTPPDDEQMVDAELEISSEDFLPELEDNISSLSESAEGETQLKPVTSNCQPPRYFILIDKIHETVIVCLRGTFSLSDLATDLTCDYENFDPEAFWDSPYLEEETEEDCGTLTEQESTCGIEKKQTFHVHKGFFEVSKRLIGYPNTGTSSPLKNQTQQATKFMSSIRNALKQRKAEDGSVGTFKKIEFVGHSLGAGVSVMLSLMLADPRTGLSTKRSGLPEGTSIRTFAICPPCTTSKGLTELSRKMVKALIHSNDFVPRLSLNHVLNLKTLIIWIDYFEANPAELPQISTQQTPDGIWKSLLQAYTRLRVFQTQNGPNEKDHPSDASKQVLLKDEVWLIELRNLLESKIQKEHQVDVLLPAGMIYWMVKDDLFIVPKHKAQDIFNQIKFDINMVKDHLIHQVKTQFVKCI